MILFVKFASVLTLFVSSVQYTILENTPINELLLKATNLEKTASSKLDIENIIIAYQNVLNQDNNNYTALCKIGNYKCLLGAGFSKKKKEKIELYQESAYYLEKAMAVNKDFLNERNNGKTVSQAAAKLGKDELDAMGYWYTVKFYYFKECLNVAGKIKNRKLIEENDIMIELVKSIDYKWSGGGVFFSKAIYHIATPEKFGGSREESKKQFALALAVDSNFICTRWGRAKYLYSITGEKEEYIKDLLWVTNQNLNDNLNSPVPNAWNIYFQNDAKKMLAELK